MWVEEAVREVSADILLLHVLLYFISPICKCVHACSFHGCPCAHGCVWQITVTARCQVHLDGNMVTICSERLFQLHLWRRVALWWKCHVFVWLLCYVRCIFAFLKSRKYKKTQKLYEATTWILLLNISIPLWSQYTHSLEKFPEPFWGWPIWLYKEVQSHSLWKSYL